MKKLKKINEKNIQSRIINRTALEVFGHHLEFMLTISLNFGVHTRNWPRIQFLSSIFGDFGSGGGGGGRFTGFQQRVKIVCLYIKLKTCSRSQKIIQYILTELKIYFTKKST